MAKLSEEQRKEIEEGLLKEQEFLAQLVAEDDPGNAALIASIQARVASAEALLAPEPTETPCPVCNKPVDCDVCGLPVNRDGSSPDGVINKIKVGGN